MCNSLLYQIYIKYGLPKWLRHLFLVLIPLSLVYIPKHIFLIGFLVLCIIVIIILIRAMSLEEKRRKRNEKDSYILGMY
jgi:hypothetical protein